jgi:hypothetical protein
MLGERGRGGTLGGEKERDFLRLRLQTQGIW